MSRGRLLPPLFGTEIIGSLVMPAQEWRPECWLLVSLLRRDLEAELRGEREVRAWITFCRSSLAILLSSRSF
jgi:hypothetical protein